MKVRRGDRRHREAFWRRLLGWILRERRDGWEQRARPAVEGSDKADRRHSQALSYDAVVDRRKECEQVPAVPAIPGTLRPGVGEAVPVERYAAPESGMEQEGGGDAKHVS